MAAKGAKVIVECPPSLAGLLASCAGISEVVPRGAALPSFDLFPWFFVIPGVLVAVLAAVAMRSRTATATDGADNAAHPETDSSPNNPAMAGKEPT